MKTSALYIVLGALAAATISSAISLRIWAARPNVVSTGPVADSHTIGPIFTEAEYLDHEFVVRNPRSYNVRILSHQLSCTCAEASYPTSVLAPGETMKLSLKLRRQLGRRNADYVCKLITDDPECEAWVFRLSASFYPHVLFEPESLHLATLTDDTVIEVLLHTFVLPDSEPRKLDLVTAVEFGLCEPLADPVVTTLSNGVVRET